MDPESYLRHVPGVIADWYRSTGSANCFRGA
ncbi:hypothetical protein AB2E34_25615 (plasmid) [Escherichia coli]